MICFGYKDKATQTHCHFLAPFTLQEPLEGHGRDPWRPGKDSAQAGQLNYVGFNRQLMLHAIALYKAGVLYM